MTAFEEISSEEFDKVNKNNDISDYGENLKRFLESDPTLIYIVRIQYLPRDEI